MSYVIDARLVQGYPQLKLIESDTGKIRLEWDYRQMTQQKRVDATPGDTDITDDGAALALKQLFKKLVLVSCMDQLSLPERAATPGFGDECIDCTACVEQPVPSYHKPAPPTGKGGKVIPLLHPGVRR